MNKSNIKKRFKEAYEHLALHTTIDDIKQYLDYILELPEYEEEDTLIATHINGKTYIGHRLDDGKFEMAAIVFTTDKVEITKYEKFGNKDIKKLYNIFCLYEGEEYYIEEAPVGKCDHKNRIGRHTFYMSDATTVRCSKCGVVAKSRDITADAFCDAILATDLTIVPNWFGYSIWADLNEDDEKKVLQEIRPYELGCNQTVFRVYIDGRRKMRQYCEMDYRGDSVLLSTDRPMSKISHIEPVYGKTIYSENTLIGFNLITK